MNQVKFLQVNMRRLFLSKYLQLVKLFAGNEHGEYIDKYLVKLVNNDNLK